MLRAQILLVLIASVFALAIAGCNSGDREVNSQPSASPGATGMPNQSAAPQAGGMSGGMPQEPTLNAIPLKQAQADYDKAKKAFDKAPTDNKAKVAYVEATNTLADSTMQSGEESGQPPNVMYPAALKLYHEVVKVDPNNSHANQWIAFMTAIYKSMGKTPPEGG